MEPLKILALSGSLRVGSFNTAALRAAQELAPAELMIDIAAINEVPMYNQDIQAEGFPQPVLQLGEAVRAADAVLIATPEYNYSIPGVLKNTLDWLSRLPGPPFSGKPVAILGASGGMIGTARAQYHLRQVFVFLNAHVMNRPEIMISLAHQKFDAEGRLNDEPTRQLMSKMLVALANWTRLIKAGQAALS
jgi:chromate reductase